MLETIERVDRAGMQLTPQRHPCESAPPALRKTKIAMVANATGIAGDSNTLQVLSDRDAKRQLDREAQSVAGGVDCAQLQVQDSRARLAKDSLPNGSGTGGGNALDPHVKERPPSSGLDKQRPNTLDRRIDNGSRTAGMRHAQSLHDRLRRVLRVLG